MFLETCVISVDMGLRNGNEQSREGFLVDLHANGPTK